MENIVRLDLDGFRIRLLGGFGFGIKWILLRGFFGRRFWDCFGVFGLDLKEFIIYGLMIGFLSFFLKDIEEENYIFKYKYSNSYK